MHSSKCSRLQNYQTAFYNMMVDQDTSKIELYIGSTLEWQLGVYQNNYKQCLQSVLNKVFKRTETYLLNNNENFDLIVSDYISETPSERKNLKLYGERFPFWLSANLDVYSLEDITVDLAKLDYYLYQCYYADNGVSFDLPSFLTLSDPEKFESDFKRSPSIFVLKSRWDLVGAIESGQFIHDEDDKLTSSDQCNYYVIHRALGIPKFEPIIESMYQLLKQLHSFSSLQEISENLDLNSEINMPILIQKQWVFMK